MRQVLIIAANTIKALLRKKDFYVLLLLLLVLLMFLLFQSFFGIRDISRYLKDVGLNLVYLFSVIIAVTFSAAQIPEEIREKTALPLLAKPVSRLHLILGRFIGSLSAAAFSYTLFFLFFAAAAYFKGGGTGSVLLLQSFILGLCLLSIVCGLTLFLSLSLTQSAAVTGSLITYFMVIWFSDVIRLAALQAKAVLAVPAALIYYLIPHYEFFDLRLRLVHSWGALPLWAFCSLCAYAGIYTALVLILSQHSFKNRML